MRDGQSLKSKNEIRGLHPGIHVVKDDILRLKLAFKKKLYSWLCNLHRIHGLLSLPVNFTFLNILVISLTPSFIKNERDWRRYEKRHYKNLI
jgi:hypothetical protein